MTSPTNKRLCNSTDRARLPKALMFNHWLNMKNSYLRKENAIQCHVNQRLSTRAFGRSAEVSTQLSIKFILLIKVKMITTL